jgi:hypothetical protein
VSSVQIITYYIFHPFLLYFYSVLGVRRELGIKLSVLHMVCRHKALCMLGKHSTSELHPQPSPFLLCAWWGFTKVLTIYKYSILEFIPSTILLHHPLPTSGIFWTGIFFPLTYMCTQYLHHIHPPSPFPHLLPTSTGSKTPGRNQYIT